MRKKLINLFVGFLMLSGVVVFGGQSPAPESLAPVKLTGSEWTLYALQGSPKVFLNMTATATNTIKIFWPSAVTNFNLVVTTNSPALVKMWVAPEQPVQNDGKNQYILVTPASGVTFYKLEAKK